MSLQGKKIVTRSCAFGHDNQLTKSRRSKDTLPTSERYCDSQLQPIPKRRRSAMKAFYEIQARDLTPESLRSAMDSRGYAQRLRRKIACLNFIKSLHGGPP